MSVKKKSRAPEDRLEYYDKLVAANPLIQRKGATHPYTALNGHMFSYLHPSGAMALRLPEAEREKFLRKYNTTLFEAYGVVQKEYVRVPDELLTNTKELLKYFQISYQYVGTLKPKPAKKKP
ncbi:MAG TPA: hypothetical protein VKU01_34710 [Bryobacteraceae bacterium]|nr:hypothetical protein [Bryobacteraceae bacterium]